MRDLAIDDVIAATAAHFSVSVDDMRSPRRGFLAHVRHVAAYIIRLRTLASYQDIARALGASDHTTAIHACRAVERSADLMHAADAIQDKLDGYIAAQQAPRLAAAIAAVRDVMRVA